MKGRQPSEALLRRRQLERLAAWLREWKIAVRLEAARPAEPSAVTRPSLDYDSLDASDRSARLCVGAKPLAAGDIVLLPPDAEATRGRPMYVALVRSERPGLWLAVPFGRFAEPALPGEWATGRRAPTLRVLCLWNHGLLEEARLRHGWRVGRLTGRERCAADRLLALRPGEAPPFRLASRIGPPLAHPLDPRHDYVEEERVLWLPRRAGLHLAERSARYELDGVSTLPMAAERKENWETSGDDSR